MSDVALDQSPDPRYAGPPEDRAGLRNVLVPGQLRHSDDGLAGRFRGRLRTTRGVRDQLGNQKGQDDERRGQCMA